MLVWKLGWFLEGKTSEQWEGHVMYIEVAWENVE